MNNAPFFEKQPTDGITELFCLIGSKAWFALGYDKQNKTANGEEWHLLCQNTGKNIKQLPLVIGEKQLKEIHQLNITKTQKVIRFCVYGSISEEQKTALLLNIAQNSPLETVRFADNLGDITEDLSGYIQRLRQDKETQKIAEMIAQKTFRQDKQLKRVEEYSDGMRKGLYLFETKYQNGTEYESIDFLCSPLKVVGLGVDYDEENEHYTLLEFQSMGDEALRVEAMANCDLGYQEGWKMLAKKGVNVNLRGRLRIELADYIQNESQWAKRWEITSKSGWKNGAYVMPNGDIIGETSSEKPLFLRIKAEKAQYYTTQGSLSDWQDHIARYAIGNSMIMLSIACGLAAPIIHLLKAPSFGLHLYVNSSSGKSIASQAGASLYGHGKLSLSSWKGTDNGIINEAISHNDGLLVMDELTQIDPKHGKDIAYALFNGEDKTRAKADGGNRKKRNWNVLVLSTGEKDLETQLEQYKIPVKAGELVRLVNIPFEQYRNFHEFTDSEKSIMEQGKAFTENLDQNSQTFYGTAGREWILYLAEHKNEIEGIFRFYNQQWTDYLPKDRKVSNQIGRVARNFAVLETACQCSRHITGWTAAEITETLHHVFNLWIENNGYEDNETRKIIEKLDSFLSQNLHRFHRKDNHGYIIEASNPAGAFVDGSEPLYYVFSHALNSEFTGFQEKHVINVLIEKGRLFKKEQGRNLSTIPSEFQRGAIKRAYCIYPPQDKD